jgi:(4S)-4-hydroxy-5-phosphonooxypentane-2,3-dione isomerase
MYIVQVHAHVKPEFIEDFRKACIENASNSLKEPGIARFDVLQQEDDPTRFTLIEVYRTAGDPPRHRETRHYKIWKDSVEPWMAEPRTKTIYNNAYPDDKGWG